MISWNALCSAWPDVAVRQFDDRRRRHRRRHRLRRRRRRFRRRLRRRLRRLRVVIAATVVVRARGFQGSS